MIDSGRKFEYLKEKPELVVYSLYFVKCVSSHNEDLHVRAIEKLLPKSCQNQYDIVYDVTDRLTCKHVKPGFKPLNLQNLPPFVLCKSSATEPQRFE